ncbi:glutamate 5-kinase [Natronococcus amylolyticus DSM 10524]|uniref:Glutamate 5-kinase n=1 Tax=Natronococcus amylolyticus DSM 10524 TaxID=1227497 RepID=L9X3L1_9EURY|nr:glutamate 5-kinase [Natronococcus amylolyticus]ELY56202.1 glutamate 5-kinase [Natronococcus amylolyticus DSM 10524]
MVEPVPAAEVAAARRLGADAERVVVKAGTNSLTDEESNLDSGKLDKLVDDLEALLERDKGVILVSSGAIGAGTGRIDQPTGTVEESQALSTVGQSHLMHRYTESFARYDRKVAQLLLTQHDLENPERFTNFRNTVETLLEWDVVPIINENDAVATAEIRIGDNDMLSTSTAIGVEADLLVTLTDVGGVYTGNPKTDGEAELIEAVGENYDSVEEIVAGGTGEGVGFGGIETKVAGARDVSEYGIPAIIAKSTEPNVLEKIATAKSVGTIFVPINGVTDSRTETPSKL